MSALAFAARGIVRQPGRALLGIAGIAATGALLFDMLMLSRGLVVSMERLLDSTGFDVRVTATQSLPPAGPRLVNAAQLSGDIGRLNSVEDAVPLRIEEGLLEAGSRRVSITFIGANVTGRRPWTLTAGQDLGAPGDLDEPGLLVNRRVADELRLSPGVFVTLRGDCAGGVHPPPVSFRVRGAADFPFDEEAARTAVTSLRHLARACGDETSDRADMVMVASRPSAGADAAAAAIRQLRPDLEAVTNEQLVERFQQVEFSYFRQISVVLASITLFFGLLLITVLLSVSTNQRLGEIAALRALGFSRQRMAADVLWRSAILVGSGGVLAIPSGFALSVWLDRLLKTMPGIPAGLHFFVFEPLTLVLHVALLALTTAVAAIYPIRIVGRLPIAGTLRNEVVG